MRAPRAGDAEFLAAHLREADLIEIAAAGEADPLVAILDGIRRSDWCLVATADGVPALIVGVAPLGSMLSDTGVPWMLGTDLVTRHQRAFIRLAPAYIVRMQSAFSHLLNFVHAENTSAVRWLKRVGFHLEPVAPYGPHGAPFHKFTL